MAKKIKIIALLPLLKFGLPQSEGQSVSLEKKQAEEIIESGYAELFVASKKEETEEETDDSLDQEEETEDQEETEK